MCQSYYGYFKKSRLCLITYSIILMRVKEESEKAALKLSIQKAKIMVSGPITSWQMEEENIEAVEDFIFLGSKITADGDCSHEIKRLLLFGRKGMTRILEWVAMSSYRGTSRPRYQTRVSCIAGGFFTS